MTKEQMAKLHQEQRGWSDKQAKTYTQARSLLDRKVSFGAVTEEQAEAEAFSMAEEQGQSAGEKSQQLDSPAAIYERRAQQAKQYGAPGAADGHQQPPAEHQGEPSVADIATAAYRHRDAVHGISGGR